MEAAITLERTISFPPPTRKNVLYLCTPRHDEDKPPEDVPHLIGKKINTILIGGVIHPERVSVHIKSDGLKLEAASEGAAGSPYDIGGGIGGKYNRWVEEFTAHTANGPLAVGLKIKSGAPDGKIMECTLRFPKDLNLIVTTREQIAKVYQQLVGATADPFLLPAGESMPLIDDDWKDFRRKTTGHTIYAYIH